MYACEVAAMAMPTYSLKYPCVNGLTLPCSQVGAGKLLSSSCNSVGRNLGLSSLTRKCSRSASPRNGAGHVMAMAGKKEVGQGGENKRQEIKLSQADMMELEFGRLLGEPCQATLAKVIGRKVNPEASYIDIEKKPIKSNTKSSSGDISVAKFAQLLNQERKPTSRSPNVVNQTSLKGGEAKTREEDYPSLVRPPLLPGMPAPQAARKGDAKTTEDLPGLVRPPLRPGMPLPQDSRKTSSVKSSKSGMTAPGKKAIPMVTFGPGGFAAQSKVVKAKKEEDDYMGLVQKPTIGSQDLYTPSWPTDEVIPPMLMGKSNRSMDSIDDDALLRRPMPGEVVSKSKTSSSIADKDSPLRKNKDTKLSPSLSGKPVLGKPTQVPATASTSGVDISEEKFAQLLELAVSPDSDRDQTAPFTASTSAKVVSVDTSSTRKAIPRLGSKPMPASRGAAQINESKEMIAPEILSPIPSNEEVVKKESTSPPIVNEKMVSSDKDAEPKVSRPVKVKAPSPKTVSGPTIVEKPILQSFAKPGLTKSEEIVSSSVESKPTKRPIIPGLQKLVVRPQTPPTAPASVNKVLEKLVAEKQQLTSPLSTSDSANIEDKAGNNEGTELGQSGVSEKVADIEDVEQPDTTQPILGVLRKLSLTGSVRPTKLSELVSTTGEGENVKSDRLAGWSEEVKAAVRRSEAALQNEKKIGFSELEFDQLLQQQKPEPSARLLKRPVPPPAAMEPKPDPIEVTRLQLAATRPAVPKPDHGRSQDYAEEPLLDRKSVTKEEEDQDWAHAEALRESRAVEEVVFAGSNAGGMLLNFRSLVGFLPAWELSGKRRPPSFTTWMQENGITLKKAKSSISSESDETVTNGDGNNRHVTDDAEYNRALQQYREARANLLSVLVGETAKVVVVAEERERRQLRFSEKATEGEGQELAQKKAQLMATLNVGDVVTCTVKKVTDFGAFVEVQGVPALIHISEMSWNRISDPMTVVNIGQEVVVKVCRLDRHMQRINLSLKQMQLDPLQETLESLVSNDLHADLADVNSQEEAELAEIVELGGVIQRLEAYKGIKNVTRGRRIQGTALAPTFQVYLSGQLEDGFKLLARSGNLVQEVLVQTALDRESMKDAIRQCTFRDD